MITLLILIILAIVLTVASGVNWAVRPRQMRGVAPLVLPASPHH